MTFVSVDQTVITEVDGEQVKVSCAVTYQDNGTGLKETSQYRLTLERAEAGNYVIARME